MIASGGPVVRGDAVVDADLGEERPGLEAQRLDHDEERPSRTSIRRCGPQHPAQGDAGLRHRGG